MSQKVASHWFRMAVVLGCWTTKTECNSFLSTLLQFTCSNLWGSMLSNFLSFTTSFQFHSFQGVSDATSGTSVGPSGTTASGDTIVEVTTVYCRIGFKGNLVCLSGLKCKRQGHAKARSFVTQERVRTYLANNTRKGKLVGAILGTKMSPHQASAVK
jgi:hypothetical protein